MEKVYIRSERAHLMCPNMQFGITFWLYGRLDEGKLEMTLQRLSQAHPFLRSVIAREGQSERLYYREGTTSRIEWSILDGQTEIWTEYEKVQKESWNVLEQGGLKVRVYEKDGGMQVIFIAHHLLGDGRGILELAGEFALLYMEGKEPDYVRECLIRGMEDLPPHSELPVVSRWIVNKANRNWRKEAKKVTYEEYLEFEKAYVSEHPVGFEAVSLCGEEYKDLLAYCKKNGVSVNDLLMARLYQASGGNKIIIAVDIRNQLACYKKGALGNYASAMGIVCKSNTTDEIQKAKEVHKLVEKSKNDNKKCMLVLACYLVMDQSLQDAAAIAGLGGLESKTAYFAGNGMFGFGKQKG